jgi:hypothetical protein
MTELSIELRGKRIFISFRNVITRKEIDNKDPHKRVTSLSHIILTCITNQCDCKAGTNIADCCISFGRPKVEKP